MGSEDNKDVHIALSIPVIITGKDGKPGECKHPGAPWGAGNVDLARTVLDQARKLLESLQAAQRDGLLTDEGLCELESLQRFYTALRQQLDRPGH